MSQVLAIRVRCRANGFPCASETCKLHRSVVTSLSGRDVGS